MTTRSSVVAVIGAVALVASCPLAAFAGTRAESEAQGDAVEVRGSQENESDYASNGKRLVLGQTLEELWGSSPCGDYVHVGAYAYKYKFCGDELPGTVLEGFTVIPAPGNDT